MTSYDNGPDDDPSRCRPPRPPGPARPAAAHDEDVRDQRRDRDVARRPRGDAGVPVPRDRPQPARPAVARRAADRAPRDRSTDGVALAAAVAILLDPSA